MANLIAVIASSVFVPRLSLLLAMVLLLFTIVIVLTVLLAVALANVVTEALVSYYMVTLVNTSSILSLVS